MKFVDWFPHYQAIRLQFGYSTEKDQEAADILSRMIKRKALDMDVLQKKIAGKRIIVVGAGDSLEYHISFIKKNPKAVKIVADGAIQPLIKARIKPDIVVTDLDGPPSFLRKAERMGSVMVVHAHGDNINAIKNIVPTFKHVIGSTQVKPIQNVHNFGGFTDGDRCVFLAEEFAAKEILLIGMEFGNHIGRYSKEVIKDLKLKKAKMKVGKHMLEMLATMSRSRLFDTSETPIRGFARFKVNVV